MSAVVTLTYLRRNRIQAEIGESYGVSQSTVSRAVTALTPLLGTALAQYVPVAEDLSPHAHYTVDGTLLPCWSWAAHLELYSGKHKTTGLNVQVACTLIGDLAWISDPLACAPCLSSAVRGATSFTSPAAQTSNSTHSPSCPMHSTNCHLTDMGQMIPAPPAGLGSGMAPDQRRYPVPSAPQA